MTFELSEILKAIGPSASIIFAAWIFMGFLQQRYDAAINRYRQAISDFRTHEHQPERHDNIREQILLYRRRCELMNWACFGGLVAAILLIFTLVTGELDVIVPHSTILTIAGAVSAFIGFALVIACAGFVIADSLHTRSQLDAELLDVPDLAEIIGKRPGRIRER
jgi:hypothetical protein